MNASLNFWLFWLSSINDSKDPQDNGFPKDIIIVIIVIVIIVIVIIIIVCRATVMSGLHLM